MKFLLITRMKDTFSMVPPDKQAQIMQGVAAFVDKYKKVGVCKEIYTIASIHGTVSVWDVESGEKGSALFTENPAFGFEDYEMYAISDFDAYMKVQMEVYQKFLGK
jgi:muconolactone delta-isomerase